MKKIAEEIQVGDKVLVLKKREDIEEFGGQKCGRSLKKGKKEKKRTQVSWCGFTSVIRC